MRVPASPPQQIPAARLPAARLPAARLPAAATTSSGPPKRQPALGTRASHDDALAAVLARAVRNRAGAHRGPMLQRMTDVDGRTAISDLNQLNAALAQLHPDLTRPPPAGGGGGPAPAPYVLPLTAAAFNGPPAAAALDQAIARAVTFLWDQIAVQEIVDDVNAMLAAPVPVVAPVIAPAEIDFEDHGYKHFGGRPHLKVKQGGAQWTLSFDAAQRLMEADIRRVEPDLRRNAQPNIQGVTSYYYTGRAAQDIGKSSGRQTRLYTIQVTYNSRTNEISYHGYPDDQGTTVGLGYSGNQKQWHL